MANVVSSLIQSSLGAAQSAPTRVPGSLIEAGLSARATPSSSNKGVSATVELSPQAQKIVAELQARDREVRAHEAAHVAAGGGLASAANFTYTIGPDGRRYAVAGDVQIDTSTTGSPQEDIARAAAIRRAALAPAQPSGQDRAVAMEAARMEIEARAALAAEREAKAEEVNGAGRSEATAEGQAATQADPAVEGPSPNGENVTPTAVEANQAASSIAAQNNSLIQAYSTASASGGSLVNVTA